MTLKSAAIWLLALPRRVFSQRWIRFGMVGAAATGSYFLLGWLFVNAMAMPLLLGNGGAYVLSFIISYAGQSRWTFQAKGRDARMLPRFAIAQALGLVLNTLIIGICARLRIIYLFSMLIASALVPVFVYFICKYWVFKPREADGQRS